MSILERVKAEEAKRQATAAHHEVERSYSHGWKSTGRSLERSDLGDIIGCIMFAAAALIGIAYFLPRFLENIR